MRIHGTLRALSILGLAAGLAAFGCAKKEPATPIAEAAPPTPVDGGKIPITTSSPEAKAELLAGRELVDNLLITDSIAHFEKAISLDPNFALAELSLSGSAPTGKEFFEHLNKAVALADKASNGERLLILATQAGANNDTAKQKDLVNQLVAAYPNDARAQFQLAGYHFGQQEYAAAIEHYKRATELDPHYSSAFNLLGYAYRQSGDFASAEKAFQQYVALIPKDPNPYDSYAELLLKMGRFDEAIAQYRKALAIDANFINAHQGIAMALLYSGKAGEATAELAAIQKKARTDGERRTGLFAQTVVEVDSGQYGRALASVQQQYDLGKKNGDVPAMAFDEGLKGNILLEMGKPDQAKAAFESQVKIIEGSNLSDEIKNNARVALHYSLARVALAKNDFAAAKAQADEYRKGALASTNPFQAKNVHELDGIIALAEKNWDKAIAELEQANAQNPQDRYRICQAYQGKGDTVKAAESCKQAAAFNTLPNAQLAFVRVKAKKGAGA